jgi:hypothetical protein
MSKMALEIAAKSDPESVAEDEANCRYQQAKRRPLPTDSMVTVRLSETSVTPMADVLSIASSPEPLYCNPLLGFERTDYTAHGNNAESHTQNNEVAFNIKAIPPPNVERESRASSIGIAEEQQTEIRRNTPRSQSRSRGSFSSMGSAHVDWDQLDKSEEQAPRDEGSDEVCVL